MDEILRGKFSGMTFHCQRTEHPDSGVFERHCHDKYELLYLSRGRGKFVVESAEYPLVPGMLLLLRPYEYHFVQPDETEPYERTVVSFRGDALDEAVRNLPIMHRQAGSAGLCYRSETAAAALTKLPLCAMLSQDRQRAMLRSVLEQTLLLCSLAEPVAPESDPLMERVMQHLTEHLTEKLSLEDLSREFFLSKSHLCRAFRRHAGVTLLDYITAKRVAAARQLLKQGVPASDAARQVGFGEYSTFYRAYRKHVGTNPSKG